MLTTQQQSAATEALNVLSGDSGHDQMVLAGFAGTGKTYTTQHIARHLVESGYAVAAITQTHKALGVLSEALHEDVACHTVYSALGWRIQPGRGTTRKTGRHKLFGVDALIVDECSMIDQDMYDGIVRLSDMTGMRILWVGDPAQLPPVGYDDSPVFTTVTHQVRLEHVVRQAKGSEIIQASLYLRRCLEHSVHPTLEGMAECGAQNELCIIRGGIVEMADYAAHAREAGLDARVVAFKNKTVDRAASMIASRMHTGHTGIVEGDPMTFVKGLAEIARTEEECTVSAVHGVSNQGPLEIDCYDIEVMLDGREAPVPLAVPVRMDDYKAALRRLTNARDRFKAKGDRESDQKAMDAADVLQSCMDYYAQLRLIYAMTAHKTQGSTFDVAVVDWKEVVRQDVRQACRMLYVACTRPSRFLVLVA